MEESISVAVIVIYFLSVEDEDEGDGKNAAFDQGCFAPDDQVVNYQELELRGNIWEGTMPAIPLRGIWRIGTEV